MNPYRNVCSEAGTKTEKRNVPWYLTWRSFLISLGHTNTIITDGKSLVLLVRSDTNVKLRAPVEDTGNNVCTKSEYEKKVDSLRIFALPSGKDETEVQGLQIMINVK